MNAETDGRGCVLTSRGRIRSGTYSEEGEQKKSKKKRKEKVKHPKGISIRALRILYLQAIKIPAGDVAALAATDASDEEREYD